MSNVPDDWHCYYRKCGICGGRWHASEGGCDCTDDLECGCGSNAWERDRYGESLACADCGGGPHEELNQFRTEHVARRDHKDGKILKGQKYLKTVSVGFFPGGRMTRYIAKRVIQDSCN